MQFVAAQMMSSVWNGAPSSQMLKPHVRNTLEIHNIKVRLRKVLQESFYVLEAGTDFVDKKFHVCISDIFLWETLA